MKKIYFWQPQSHTYWQGKKTYWLPYSVGCLWSYALQHDVIRDHYELGDWFFARQPIDQALAGIDCVDVAVFSCYIWNFEYNKKMAQAVRSRWPGCKIIFGGPQITNRPLETNFFRDNPYVNHVINGEGEIAFVELLANLALNQPTRKNISFTRLKELGYPSPYSGGLFDSLVKRYPDYHWQAVIETNRGCPYACTFCDWGSLTYSKVLKFPEQRVLDDITWCSQNRVIYMMLADANFGIFHDRDKKIARHINHVQHTMGFPQVVNAQWAKNGREKILEIAQIFFNDYNRGFTLSVQSMDDAVLEAIKRKNMEVSDMSAMLALCVDKKIPAYSELILGLPYETRETWRENHCRLLEIGQHHALDVWWTQLLENAELSSPQQRREHEIKSMILPKIVSGSVADDDVMEYEELIIATKYMSTHDMIDSYVFSAILIACHYFTGATSVLSRVLYRNGRRSYGEFYGRLQSEIMSRDLWISAPFKRLHKALSDFFLLAQNSDTELYHSLHSAIWIISKPLILEPKRVIDDLFAIFTAEWCGIDQELYQTLRDFALCHMVDWANRDRYPMIKTFDRDVYNYAIGHVNSWDAPATYEFSYAYEFSDLKSFFERAYHDRRTRDVVNTRVRFIDGS